MAPSIADSAPSGEKPASLEARPKADALSVERLMMELGQGRIRIPEFQRELSWDADDARKLVDSVYRGYPVGTTILWKRPAGTAKLTFGSLSIVASERQDALWVVDGQQRITSLARVLLPPDPNADAFATYFDLDDAQFVSSRRARAAKDPARFLPLTEVLDSVRLQLWASGRKLDERRMKSAFRLGSRIREYSIPTYIVQTPDETALREMFGRLNSAGKPLTDAEVFNALHGVRSSDTARDLRDITKELSRLEFGELEGELVYKSC